MAGYTPAPAHSSYPTVPAAPATHPASWRALRVTRRAAKMPHLDGAGPASKMWAGWSRP